MTYSGTINRVQRTREGVTVILDIGWGLRGIELDRDEWAAILADFGVTSDEDVTGWKVEYSPATGDFEITGPDDDETG